ncbi:RagB/SusD family nutrient uptake outer membrane protein [Zeaxanthinibacter sp. PT1]|uniref:RagB/SusD family nutrient uptake outer membrane protein n=1 Tax=Zeaxanthinibacter TaxID=561554 RepID=UPI00234B862D|nr:RagB/SusD family nutrient uptake outer membrane protein [Zeaxanthinibacter sp. PT1]MDC6350501.1 RagB/SusD family nutrient uptake outer membrane protein [Zeaxanthinibacter sp. PT1]
MKNYISILFLSFAVLLTQSCDTEYLDPNSTLEPDVVNSTENLVKLINGIQQRWSTDRAGMIYTKTHIAGLNTDELRLLNPGNLGENELLLGGDDINGGNELLNNIWTQGMLARKEATTIIDAAEQAADDTATANSLKAYGLFYRALVHGTLIQYFEQLPLEIETNATFENRSTVLQSAIADLQEAKGYAEAGIAAEVSADVFQSVDLENSINALLARFNLMAGNYTAAITAADQVDLGVRSIWEFDAAIPNPLAFWFGSQNVTQAKDLSFGLPPALAPETDDDRVPFYVTADDLNAPSPNYQVVGFYDDNLDEIPVYLPGEMLLIKAEAHARNGDLGEAVNELNTVRTKTAATDAFGLGADLPPYSGPADQDAILDEIYKNRRIELYLTGLALEDSRRFNRPGPGAADPERNRNYYPYPNAERDNNTNTPANPAN